MIGAYFVTQWTSGLNRLPYQSQVNDGGASMHLNPAASLIDSRLAPRVSWRRAKVDPRAIGKAKLPAQ
jgi:hypothetical protein